MSLEIALEKIERAKRDKAIYLDLRDLGLKEIPSQIGNLVNLTTLHLEDNQIQEIPKFLLDLGLPIYYLMGKENNLKKGIFLKNNPLEIPPTSVVRKGNEAIENFFISEEKRLKEAEKKLKPPKIFISYSHEDMLYKKELVKHLKPLVRAKKITVWDDGQITVGEKWKKAIFDHLHEADIVLCLISSDFINSEFCHEKELAEALKAHKEGRQTVIPIRIRKCFWDHLPISKLQGCPANWMIKAKDDGAWTEVVKAIKKSLENLSLKKSS